MKKYLKAVLTLVIVVTFSTVAIWGINSITAPIIKERADKEAIKAYAALVDGTIDSINDISENFDFSDTGIEKIVELGMETGSTYHALTVRASGYKGELILYVMVVDINEQKTVGISIIEEHQTPSIGGKLLKNPDYLNKFKDQSLSGSMNTAGVDMAAGATQTSAGLDSSVNTVLKFVTDNNNIFVGGDK